MLTPQQTQRNKEKYNNQGLLLSGGDFRKKWALDVQSKVVQYGD